MVLMVFFFRKFIEMLFLPIGFSGLLVVAGILLRRRWLALTGVAALYLFSTPVVATFILRPLENAYPPSTIAAAPSADAIVVLSGGIVRGVMPPGVQWGDAANRYFTGYDLAMAGKAPSIIFTDAGTEDARGGSQAVLVRQAAIRGGVAQDRIIVTGKVLTTADEAREVAQIPTVHSVLLVTSAFHMPRAVLLFQNRGLKVYPFPTDERTWSKSYLISTSFIPTSSAIQRSEEAMREYLGLTIYRLLILFRLR